MASRRSFAKIGELPKIFWPMVFLAYFWLPFGILIFTSYDETLLRIGRLINTPSFIASHSIRLSIQARRAFITVSYIHELNFQQTCTQLSHYKEDSNQNLPSKRPRLFFGSPSLQLRI